MATVFETIRTKHSVRYFTDQALTTEEIEHIIDAGRRAQSGFNSQPWQFIVVTERELLQEVSKIGRSLSHVARAAMCLVLLTPQPDDDFWRNMFDAGQAAAYMQLTAQEMGIGSCPGTVYHPEMAREMLGFPEEWDLRVVISFGYPDREQHPARPPKQGQRKPLDDVLHWNGW